MQIRLKFLGAAQNVTGSRYLVQLNGSTIVDHCGLPPKVGREGRRGPYPEIPLYTTADAREIFPLLSPVRYGFPQAPRYRDEVILD